MTDDLTMLSHLTLALAEEQSRLDKSETVILAIETAMRVVNERKRYVQYIELSQKNDD